MSTISTHVLDTSSGTPAAGIGVVLEMLSGGDWELLGADTTDFEGRIGDSLTGGVPIGEGTYRLRFDTGGYFAQQGGGFYPHVQVAFAVTADEHYHVPLLLSPFGFTTYRGS